jgi:hypothetical protein
MEGTSTEEGLLKREIEDLPVVSSLSFHRAIGRDYTGYRANLRCPAASSHGGCTDGGCTVKQVGPIRMSGQCPTLLDCLRELKALIMRDHGDNCVAAAQAWLAANHTDNMVIKPDAMQTMMRPSAAKNRAKAAQDRAKATNNDALQAEQEKDAAEKEVQELQRVLEPTRARKHAASAHDDKNCGSQSSDDWDLADYRRETTRIQNRRSTPLGSRGEVPTPQEGKTGQLEHSRLGLVGWIAYWSLGNCAPDVKIIVGLIHKLNLTESVFEKRVAEWVDKVLPLAKPGVWGCVQTRA